MLNFSKSKRRYTSAVETPIYGLARTTQQVGGAGSFEMISPRPVANAVPPYTQKETSDPISAPNSANSSIVNPNFQSLFKPS